MRYTKKSNVGKRIQTKKNARKPQALAAKVNRNRDVHFFKRSYAQIAPGSFAGNVAYAPYLNAYSFNLAQLPNYTEFSNLFDRYMLTHVQLRFTLKIDPSAQAAASAVYPKLYYVKDYDDSSSPASLDVLREHSRCVQKVLYPNRPVIVNVKPAILQEIYRSGVATTYSPRWKTWIDCNTMDCPHYGLKWGLDDFTNTNMKIDIEGKMWFACKDAR